MIGTILNSRYRLDAQIGEGGMAIVYRGYDLLLRRQVAIKALRPQFAADQAFVERFSQEAQAAAKLSHPNIVNTYDVGQADGSRYIVQEYVPGETLAALIARQGPLPEKTAINYALQIGKALAAAHRNDLLHRDIKPSNIIVTSDDVVRVTDFGIARAANEQTLTSVDTVLGSVPYCSPEQLGAEPLAETSDLYSLGIVLYEMVTGKRPYHAETAIGTAMAHVRSPIPEPSAAGVSVSPALTSVIRKLMQKDPAGRYASAGEVLVALRSCAAAAEADEIYGVAQTSDTPTAVLRRRSRSLSNADRPAMQALEPRWDARRVIAVAGSIFGVLFLAMLFIAAREAASRGLRMPDVSGKSLAEAITSLHASGIDNVAIRQQSDANAQAGLIDATTPPANERLRAGDTVTLSVSTGPPMLQLANLIGRDLKEASAWLTAQGFRVKVLGAVHTAMKQGAVYKLAPPAGSQLAKGSTVVLVPSAGLQLTAVPNLVSLTEEEARRQLAGLGLRLTIRQTVPSANIPAHTIIDQQPSDGTNVAAGSAVIVDVAGGPNSVTVPNAVGGSLDEARRGIEQAGLSVGSITQAAMPDTPPGTVVSQSPSAGERLAQGASIDLVVAAGAAAPSSDSVQPSATASVSPTANNLPPIPNVVGMTADAAKATLQKAGYRVDKVTTLSGTPSNARVVSTEPEPGATTPPGSIAVNLVLGPPSR